MCVCERECVGASPAACMCMHAHTQAARCLSAAGHGAGLLACVHVRSRSAAEVGEGRCRGHIGALQRAEKRYSDHRGMLQRSQRSIAEITEEHCRDHRGALQRSQRSITEIAEERCRGHRGALHDMEEHCVVSNGGAQGDALAQQTKASALIGHQECTCVFVLVCVCICVFV